MPHQVTLVLLSFELFGELVELGLRRPPCVGVVGHLGQQPLILESSVEQMEPASRAAKDGRCALIDAAEAVLP